MCKLMNSSLGRSGFADKHADRASWGGGRGRLSREGPASPGRHGGAVSASKVRGRGPAWEDPNLTAFYGGPRHRSSALPLLKSQQDGPTQPVCCCFPPRKPLWPKARTGRGAQACREGPRGGESSTPGQTNVPRGSHLETLNKTGCCPPQERVWGFEAPFRVRGGKGPDRRVPSLPPDPAPVLGNCTQTCHNQPGKE